MNNHKHYVLKFLALILMVTGADLFGAAKVTPVSLQRVVTCDMSKFKRADPSHQQCFQCSSSNVLFCVLGCTAERAVCLNCIENAKAFFTLSICRDSNYLPVGINYQQQLPKCPSCKVLFHSREELEAMYPVKERERLVLQGINHLLASLRDREGAGFSVSEQNLKALSKPFTNSWFWK